MGSSHIESTRLLGAGSGVLLKTDPSITDEGLLLFH